MRTMAEGQVYYKWKLLVYPDEKSRKRYDVSPTIEILSPNTFEDYNECIQAGREYDMDLPASYGGPYLQVIKTQEKDRLEDIYKYHKDGDTTEIHKAYSGVEVEDIDEIHLPRDASKTCRLLDNIEDVKQQVLKRDRYFDPSNSYSDFDDWKLEPRYSPKSAEYRDYAWHQVISHNIELAVGYNVCRGPKLYIYRGMSRVVALRPSELYTLVQMYDNIMVKMYQCDWKPEVEWKKEERKDEMCRSGHGCTHDYTKT